MRSRLTTSAPPALLLVVAVLIAYLPALQGGYIWDDNRYVTENPVLPRPDGLAAIWTDPGATIQYYPMVFTTFWLEYRLWGLNPLGYHATNILLHALSALLLWAILRRLAVPGAWLAAALFALHPVHVESVAWVTERKNVLSGLFYLAALLTWLRVAPPAPSPGRRWGGRRWGAYALTLLLFLLALFSKTVTCSLPAVLLLILWWRRDRLPGREALLTVPMFIMGIGMGSVTMWMERTSVGCEGPDWAFTLAERILIAGRAVWFYLGKLLIPHELVFNYPRWTIDSAAAWQYLFPLAVLITIAALYALRRRVGKGPLVAYLFFCGSLFPALGFVNTYPMRYSFVADHFQYLASIGPLTLAAALITLSLSHRTRPAARRIGLGAQALVLVVLGLLTWQQGKIYADRETIWRDTLSKNPESFLAHCNLGGLLLDRGDAAAAQAHLIEAVRLKPDFHEAHASLGRALVDQDRVEEGIRHYREAVRLKPAMAWAHQSLGSALLKLGRTEEALASHRRAVLLDPDFFAARFNLASALAARGELEEAIAHFRIAVALEPEDARVHTNLGDALAQQGSLEEALMHYQRAIDLDTDACTAHRNLAAALVRLQRPQDAIQAYWMALRCNPRDPLAHRGLAGALAQTGRLADAVKEYRRTLALDPNDAVARQALEALGASSEDSSQ